MRNVYDGLQDLLVHTARQISDCLEEEYAQMLDVMYFPQLVIFVLRYELKKGIFGYCACWGGRTASIRTRRMGLSIFYQ